MKRLINKKQLDEHYAFLATLRCYETFLEFRNCKSVYGWRQKAHELLKKCKSHDKTIINYLNGLISHLNILNEVCDALDKTMPLYVEILKWTLNFNE